MRRAGLAACLKHRLVSATVRCPGLLGRTVQAPGCAPHSRAIAPLRVQCWLRCGPCGPAKVAESTKFTTQAWPYKNSTVVSLTTDNTTLLSATALTCPDLAFAFYDEAALAAGLAYEPACGPTTGTAVRLRGPGLLDLGDLRCDFQATMTGDGGGSESGSDGGGGEADHGEADNGEAFVQGVLVAGEVVCMAPSAAQPTNVRLAARHAAPRCCR